MSSQHHTDRDAQPTITRRTFLKASAAAVPAATLGTTATTGAKAASLGPMPVSPKAMSVVDWATGSIDASKDVNESPDENKVALHQTAMSAKEWLDTTLVYASNHLEDAKSIAHIEARNALATAWENGKTSDEGAGQATQAIDDYYAKTLYVNHIEAAAATLMQLKHVSDAARAVDDTNITDEFVADFSAVHNYTGSGSISDQYLGDIVTTTLTSLDGSTTFEVDCPEIVVVFDNGDEYRQPITDEWLTNFTEVDTDPLTGYVSVTTANGETLDLEYQPTVIAVPESGLQSQVVWNLPAFMQTVDAIQQQASDVKANYDLSFADSLFTALDDGTVTPSAVRGAGGQAKYMAGGDASVTGDAYKLAMYHQLGMEQADLSKTASMQVSYSGGTEWGIWDKDGNDPRRYPGEVVSGESYAGLLYGREVSGLAKGRSYGTNPLLYMPDGGGIQALDPTTGDPLWSAGSGTGNTRDFIVLPEYGEIAIVNGGELYIVNRQTGEQINYFSTADSPISGAAAVYYHSADSHLYAAEADSAQAQVFERTEADDGWKHLKSQSLPSEVEHLESEGGTPILSSRFPTWGRINPTSGSWAWSLDDTETVLTEGPGAIAVVDGTVYAAADGVVAASYQMGGVQWEVSESNTAGGIGIARGSVWVVYNDNSNTVKQYDRTDGSVLNTFTASDLSAGYAVGVTPEPDSSRVTVNDGSTAICYDPSDGSTVWSTPNDHINNPSNANPRWSLTNRRAGVPHTHIYNATFYDAPSSSEIQMVDGVMTVSKMSDTEGNEITPVTQQTLDDLVAKSNNASNVDELLAQVDGLDAAEDVDGVDDVEQIAQSDGSISSLDGVSLDTQDYQTPQYDSYDNTEYGTYTDKVNDEYESALKDEYAEENSSGGGGIGIGGSSGSLVGGVFVGGLALLGLKGFADKDD